MFTLNVSMRNININITKININNNCDNYWWNCYVCKHGGLSGSVA